MAYTENRENHMKRISQRAIIDDQRVFIEDEQPAQNEEHIAVSLKRYLEGGHNKCGVRIEPEEGLASILPHLGSIPFIEIHFPTFMDGRGYTYAQQLRHQLGYQGDLIAVGDIGKDQLHYMDRVGFNVFALRDGTDIEDALGAFALFSHHYRGVNTHEYK